MVNKSYILRSLKSIMAEYLREPRWGLRQEEFEERSLRIWAADEVLRAIEKSGLPPREAILDFIAKCNRFLKYRNGTEIIFFTAKEVALTMIDIVKAME